ncbi:MAG: hypothetical protein Q9M23_01370, partial [Mariprofundaceae bacterium]|nr:hypothetical protein [Mariprofundaceae bacterium]
KSTLTDRDFSDIVQAPASRMVTVNTTATGWAPAICFVHDGHCAQTLSFVLGSAELDGFECKVWVAGEKDVVASFYWDVWTTDSGWKTLAPVSAAPDSKITGSVIDPDAIDDSLLMAVQKPVDTGDGGPELVLGREGQAVLYAERTYQQYLNGPVHIVRSNLLMITVYTPGST